MFHIWSDNLTEWDGRQGLVLGLLGVHGPRLGHSLSLLRPLRDSVNNELSRSLPGVDRGYTVLDIQWTYTIYIIIHIHISYIIKYGVSPVSMSVKFIFI